MYNELNKMLQKGKEIRGFKNNYSFKFSNICIAYLLTRI